MEFEITSDTRSFIIVSETSHFPIQNLPFGVFKRDGDRAPHIGVAIGDQILDLFVMEEKGYEFGTGFGRLRPFSRSALNEFMHLGRPAWHEARLHIGRLLSTEAPDLRDDAALKEQALVAMKDVEMVLPVEIGDYTDFYASREHATNVGTMFRGADNALMPNWLHLPVGYHGRASSLIISGTDVHRPRGQTISDDDNTPSFGPSRLMDFELEMGFLIGPGNELGRPITTPSAPDHIFGFLLVNDWSARDIQKWEYVPLGPFLGKSFATSVSPWVVTAEALEPFRCAGPEQDPEPLPYLRCLEPRSYDIHLEVALQGSKMDALHRICRSNFRHMYWSVCQQLVHHSSNGCNLRTGDLLASGTISGPDPGSYGSMLELAGQGSQPIEFPNGETRTFLEDGDRVVMTGWAQGAGFRVGFGEVSARVLPALESVRSHS